MSKTEIKYYLVKYLKRKGVLKASIFGSLARNENTENSDVDLIVKLKEDKSLLDLIEIKLDLEEYFKKNVDLITYTSINPLLRNIILNEQEILFEEG